MLGKTVWRRDLWSSSLAAAAAAARAMRDLLWVSEWMRRTIRLIAMITNDLQQQQQQQRRRRRHAHTTVARYIAASFHFMTLINSINCSRHFSSHHLINSDMINFLSLSCIISLAYLCRILNCYTGLVVVVFTTRGLWGRPSICNKPTH